LGSLFYFYLHSPLVVHLFRLPSAAKKIR